MARIFLFPGEFVCAALGMRVENDHRQILRTFVNILIWGIVATWIAVKLVP